jgi:PAS domain S-box-containing protein
MNPMNSSQTDSELKVARLHAEALARDLEESLSVANNLRQRAEQSAQEIQAKNRQIRLLSKVAVAANEATSVEDALQASVREICIYTQWQGGHTYMRKDHEPDLVSNRMWYFLEDDDVYEPFREATDMVAFTPGQGLIGKVATDGNPRWSTDMSMESAGFRYEIAQECGIYSLYAFPIFMEKRVLGVMEFISTTAKEPDEALIKLMSEIGVQLGHVVVRKQSEEKARLLEQVILNARDAIMITRANAQDVSSSEITFVNKAFTEITGYDTDEIVGKSPALLYGKNTDHKTLDRMNLCLARGQAFKGEVINYARNGHEYWSEVSIVPVHDLKGRITHYAAIERDITSRKSHEVTLLKAKDAAEMANRAKGDFLANMSHELRTPMNGILGMTGLLSDTALCGEQMELVETVKKSSENLLMLLNDILDFSKIEAQELTLEEIPFDLKKITADVAGLLEPLAQNKDITLSINYNPSNPTHVLGDSARIRQILTNLVGNAIKFTERGYVKIDISSRRRNDGRTEFLCRIDDSGAGIAEDKRDKIFQKFTQADESTTRKYGGTGLGLAICKHLTEMMGGEIGVQSVEGKGSSFWFTMPLHIPNTEQIRHITDSKLSEIKTQLHVATRCDFSTHSVLVVDDHPINLMFAAKLLKKFGFNLIETVDSGEAALRKLETNTYDIIITDCQMPEMDGYELSRSIRAREAGTGRHVPIIAMTANAMVGDKEKCLVAGMDDYASKPIVEAKLREILARWLQPSALPESSTAILPLPITSAPAIMDEIDMEAFYSPATPPASVPNDNVIVLTPTVTTPPQVDFEEFFNDNAPQVTSATTHTDEPHEQPSLPSAAVYNLPVSTLTLQDTKLDTPPVDLEHLRSYIGDDPEEEKEVITMFVELTEKAIEELHNALNQDNADVWKKVSHRIKGSASNFGAKALSQTCLEAEHGHERPQTERLILLNTIQGQFNEARNFLGALHQDLPL